MQNWCQQTHLLHAYNGSTTSADTPMNLAAQVGASAKSADTPAACLSQTGGSTKTADMPLARLSQTDAPTVVQAAPRDIPAPLEGMPGTPEDVTAMANHADDVADSSGDRMYSLTTSDNENQSKDSVSITSANATLMYPDQETLTAWVNRCKEQTGQVTHLAGVTHELLTTDHWTCECCDEFMHELDEELEKLKNLYEQFSTDKLSTAMRHEAIRLQNNVHVKVTRARK
jgi:hypothetical protein